MADFQAGKHSEALKGFKELKKMQPGNVEIFMAIAQVWVQS